MHYIWHCVSVYYSNFASEETYPPVILPKEGISGADRHLKEIMMGKKR